VFRISDFSRLTRVTVKALRHYDRLGLLKPVRVDDQTGYRYYSARQAADVAHILALKELGLSLEHIGDLLSRKTDRTSLARLLDSKRVEIESRLEADRARLRQVEASLRDLESGASLPGADVVLRENPPLRVAARRAKVAELDDGVEELFEALEADVAKAGVRAGGPPILLYHDRDHREEDARVEVCVPVLSDARSAGRSAIRTLPGVPRAACVLYRGSYEQWGGVARGLLAWLQARRLEPAGPMREVFLQFGTRDPKGHQIPPAFLVDDAGDLLTEMQIPVRRRAARAARA
jgi:DNA-binding transcriptional MerR regulator